VDESVCGVGRKLRRLILHPRVLTEKMIQKYERLGFKKIFRDIQRYPEIYKLTKIT
jgi:hypothetical protein